MAAHSGKNGVGIFFIYDHTRLQKEEDDLKDAILYFYPPSVSEDDQCAMCGQLMGISEFLYSTISKSAPTVFKLQNGKYCLKRLGHYTLGLEGSLEDSDIQLGRQLTFLYDVFVMYCGSLENIRQKCNGNQTSFVKELHGIWDILYPAAAWHDSYLTQAFQILPSVNIPKGRGELFLQASDILQSSQRRPGVLLGIIVFKNRVLCSQVSAELTRKLIIMNPSLPCLDIETDFELPMGVRLASIFLEDDQYDLIMKNRKTSHQHNQTSKFVWTNDTESEIIEDLSAFHIKRSNSRTDFLRKKEMEIIPEKEDNVGVSGISEEKVKDQQRNLNENLSGTNHDQIWKSANHQESKTFESQIYNAEEIKRTLVTDQSEIKEEETISDLEKDDEIECEKLNSSSEDKTSEFHSPNDLWSLSLTSSDDDGKRKCSLDVVKPEVVIVAEMPGCITDSIEEDKDVSLQSSACNKVMLKSTDECKNESININLDSGNSENGSSRLSVGQSNLNKKSPSSFSSDVDMTEPETSDAESMSTGALITADLISLAKSSQRKERLEFKESEIQDGSCEDSVDDTVKISSLSSKDSTIKMSDSVNSSIRSSKHSSLFSSLKDSVSSRETNSSDEHPDWMPADNNLHNLTLYVQCHSDISLLLLIDDSDIDRDKVITTLWKGALPLLADLDFHIKNCMEDCDTEMYLCGDSYLKYDSFFQSLDGNTSQPVMGSDDEFQRLAGSMHNDFIQNNQLTDVVFRTLSSSCYGHKTEIDETFYSAQQMEHVAPLQFDPSFSTDILARRKLSTSGKSTLL